MADQPAIVFNGTAIPATPTTPGSDLLGLMLDAKANVRFLCMGGSCRQCRVELVSGGEHLEPKSDGEAWGCPDDGARLACQAIHRGTGTVVLKQ